MKGNFKDLGKYLAEKRLEKGLSQNEVANLLGYSSGQFISNFERGICAPPLKKLRVLMGLYSLSLDRITRLLLDAQENFIRGSLASRARSGKR